MRCNIDANIIESTVQSIDDATQWSTVEVINQAINVTLAFTPKLASTQIPSLETFTGMIHQNTSSHLWESIFSDDGERENDGILLIYNHDLHGFIGGYEKLLDGNLFGFFIGMSKSQSQTKIIYINEIEIRSISY